MSEKPRAPDADVQAIADRLEAESALDETLGMSGEELDRDLAAAGFDPAKVEARARAHAALVRRALRTGGGGATWIALGVAAAVVVAIAHWLASRTPEKPPRPDASAPPSAEPPPAPSATEPRLEDLVAAPPPKPTRADGGR